MTSVLQRDRPAGGLAVRHDRGRTWFSVNGDERRFGAHQGFFEFAVALE
jgi:hypothetical protein